MEMLHCGSSGNQSTAVHSPASHHTYVREQLLEACVLPTSLQVGEPEGAASSPPGAAGSSTDDLGMFGQSMFSVFAQESESGPFPTEPLDDFGPPASARRRFRCVSFVFFSWSYFCFSCPWPAGGAPSETCWCFEGRKHCLLYCFCCGSFHEAVVSSHLELCQQCLASAAKPLCVEEVA